MQHIKSIYILSLNGMGATNVEFSLWISTKKGVAKTVYIWRVAICLEHFWGILAVYVNVMVKNGEKSISLVTLKFSEITTQRTNK